MLEFVHLSGNAAGKDLQTRRKVRSQAMRDFRRRQRAERESASQSTTPKATESERESREGSISGESKRATTRTRRKSSRGVKSKSFSEQPSIINSTPTSSAQTPAIFLFEDVSGNIEPRWNGEVSTTIHQAHPDATHWIPHGKDNSSQTSRRPSSWGAESDDLFQSPAQINQMFNFCKSYIHWLRPGTDADTAEDVLRRAWGATECPMLLAACCLASVGHLDSVQPNRPGGNYALYKARVLREVSVRMQSPATATSDLLIGTLGCLLSFEMSRGSGEALTHLQGLKSIVKMKGGMESLTFLGISRMLETLDLLHAVIFDSEPVLTSPELLDLSTGLELSDAETFARLTPLLLAEQEDYQRIDTSYSEILDQFPEVLNNAVLVLEGASLSDPYSKDKTGPIERFQESVERFGQLGSEESIEAQDAHHLARACHFTLVLFYNLVVHKIPHRHRSNQKYADGLYCAIRSIKDKTWEDIHYLRLWILLTGAATSIEVTQKSFFKAQLVRAIYQMGPGEFRRIKDFIFKYLSLKQALERPARRATPPVELITPTTHDTSYLYASWPNIGRSVSPHSMATTVDDNLSHRSPYFSRDPSPSSYVEPIALTMPPAPESSFYEDMNIDPFLKFGGLDTSADMDELHRGSEGMIAANRGNDFWFLDLES